MAEAIGGRKRIHKLPKLSVSFIVRRSSFHRHSEGGNNLKKTKQTVSQISNCHFYYCLFLWGVRRGSPWTGPDSGPWTRSVGGPWIEGQCFRVTPSVNVKFISLVHRHREI